MSVSFCGFKALVVVAFTATLMLSACKALEPVRRPAFTVGVTPIGEEKMGEGVKKGLLATGWTVLDEKPGKIDAKLKLSGEMAIIYVTYSDIDYIINLKQVSEGLDYDGNRINRRYNYWVDRLSKAIQGELRKL